MKVTSDALDAGLLTYSSGSVVGSGGFVDGPNQRYRLTHELPIGVATPENLAAVVVSSENGKIIRIGDVADVVIGHQPLIGDAVINDGPGLMLIVEKLPWGNTLDVTKGVESRYRRHATRSDRCQDRHHDLPARNLRRGGP